MAMATATRTAVTTEVRDDLSRVATKVKEEANGQALDVAEMADAARVSLNAVKDAQQRFPDGGGDPKVQARLQTLGASLKAYHNRLANLGSEAKSIHREAENLVKHVWGTGAPDPVAPPAEEADEPINGADFDADAPHVAKILEQKPVASKKPAAASSNGAESVEAERVTGSTKKSQEPAEPEEIEVLEVEVESPEEDLPVTQITQELYERGVDFADCHDAAALRKRYADMKAGKFDRQEPPRQQQQTRAPAQQQQQQQQQSYHPYQGQQSAQNHGGSYGSGQYNANSTTTETAPAFDPHPGAQRKMMDPMKTVWEVKTEIGRENGVDPNTLDLWSGPILLEDHKRLHDYGTQIQANPIQVRNKGDAPQFQ